MTTREQKYLKNGATRYEKGRSFEEQVARWIKRQLSGLKTTVATNQYANGLSVRRPYQIDVHAKAKGKGLLAQEADIWIECKWKGKSSVKRTDIMKLVVSAQDVYRAAEIGRNEIYYNVLVVVSNQKFDIDAINYADQEDVLCVTYDGKKYEQQNKTNKWLREPAWLRRLS